ncbi:glycosyltransferase family 2 protein [Halomonas casei]|uniref:glycosyltransferase family 2 protein n=1 Tax=Halomonas casei TaxID=2742613 RepID=UPI003CE7BF5F
MTKSYDQINLASVSVVIPFYQSCDVIRRALDSIYNQNLIPLEVIIVDDYSNDGSLNFLNSLISNFHPSWLKIIKLNQNGGPGTARNAGWNSAKGDYVAFLDADDAWHPCKLEIQYSWMKLNPKVGITGHPFTLKEIDHRDALISKRELHEAFSITKYKLLSKNYFPTPTIMVKRELNYRFPEGKKHSEEYLLACEICCDNIPCAAFALPLTYIFKRPYGVSGLSGNVFKMELGELDVYSKLLASNRIRMTEYVFFSIFSLIKFSRRCILVAVQKLKN